MEIVDIALPAGRSEDRGAWRKAAARVLRVAPERIGGVRLVKQSVDARRAPVKVRLRLEVSIDGELPDIPYPIVPGHEIVGEVVTAPAGSTHRPGDRVGVPWLGHTCGHCGYCGRTVTTAVTPGHPLRYCSKTCKKRAEKLRTEERKQVRP